MREVVTIAKALADENRVRILAMLQGKELCVCRVVELLAPEVLCMQQRERAEGTSCECSSSAPAIPVAAKWLKPGHVG